MKKNAQASLEFLIAAGIIFAMLLFGILFIIQQNNVSSMILNANSDNIECNKIADAISRVYASHSTAEENIYIAKNAVIYRTENAPGQITIGNNYCNYFGNAERCNGAPDCSYTTDGSSVGDDIQCPNINGFCISAGNTYKLSKAINPDAFGRVVTHVLFTQQ
ncbi:MAG TPA: hypothetical protein VI977_02650 [archaeon]|nr:hypothetical protein [archaeon]